MTDLVARARAWLAADPDPVTRAEVAALLDAGDDAGLAARFGGRLRFGTAGLRGPLRAGPDGMNRAVVRRTAAGLAAWLGPGRTVVVGHDARHGSADFARDSAAVLAGAGLRAQLLPEPLPTPVLAFAVRHLGADAGVAVTASHNPATDNGYKVYDGTGAQVPPEQAAEIEVAVDAVAGVPGADAPYGLLGPELLEAYLDALPRVTAGDLVIGYTPLHGVGGAVFTRAWRRAGFPPPRVVEAQAGPDPDFPTVPFPNPEEPGAMDAVLALGQELSIAHDPDADRLAVAVGTRLLTGDEVGVLLGDHLLGARGTRGPVATTVVSSSMLARVAAGYGVPCTTTLTGFKHLVRAGLGLVYAYEEALGYAVAPDVVRDKDGISAALLLGELAAAERARGRSLLDRLADLERAHGVHRTGQVTARVPDPGARAAAVRAAPPTALAGEPVTAVELPAADVLVLRAASARVVVRPSGTEPKVKAYLETVGDGASARLDAVRREVETWWER